MALSRYQEAMRFTLDGESFELTPELVRARLAGQVPEPVRQYWVEIDGIHWPVKQVIALATGVRDRQRFQSQASRRWLQRLGFQVGEGAAVLPSRPTQRPRAAAMNVPGPARPDTSADVVLVGCVKSKLGHAAAAKDLYVSDYFAKMRAYAEASRLPWFILSAEHGLIDPEQWLEPYERYLADAPTDYRRAWGERVARQLEAAMGPLSGLVIEVHAGAAYVESVRPALGARGARVVDPLHGLSLGRRLSWYGQSRGVDDDEVSRLTSRLTDGRSAMPLSEFVGTGGDQLRVPGIYSWWVDEPGAASLSAGLGIPVRPGLIYAGLAGATRPGGKASSNTLWGRIAGMHLGAKHQFSTLRLSLGSVLAEASRATRIDEARLTGWMHAHLRVIAIPVAEVATLDALESAILTRLDPPLNLAKVPKTPSRTRLSELRKLHGGKGAPGDDDEADVL